MYTGKPILEINLAKIRSNYKSLVRLCKNSRVAAVVKADGYGIGANEVANELEKVGCYDFFVASLDEGINLRKKLEHNIYVLNGAFEDTARELYRSNLIPVLNNLQQIKIWRDIAQTAEEELECVLHFDIGMNRVGLHDEEINYLINNDDFLSGIEVKYIMSHLTSSEVESPINMEQLAKFKQYIQHFPTTCYSLANSSGIFLGEEYHFNLTRPGAALYGLNPLPDKPNPMKNPIKLLAPIMQIKELSDQSLIGYNGNYATKRTSTIATLPIGYADGYFRAFSNKGEVYIEGHICPVVGNVSMDYITVDVTDVPLHRMFLGQYAEIVGDFCTADKIANMVGTIGYEVLTNLNISNRYKKIYTQ